MKLSLLSLFLLPALASAAPAPPKPTTAPRGRVETVAQIMARREVQPSQEAIEKDDSDHYPDRTHLPQNPGSLPVSSYPGRVQEGGGGAPLTAARGPIRGGNSLGGGPLISLGFGFSPTSSNETPYRPPDTQGDVSPTQILVCINGRIKVFDRSGVLGSLNTTTDTFFASVRGASISDPRVRWDPLLQRWIVIAIDVASSNNRVVIAASNSATIDASTTFSFFYFNEGIGGGSTAQFADYPTLGVDRNALYIGTNQFQGNYQGSDGFVVRKSSLIPNGSPVVTHFVSMGGASTQGTYTPQGVDNDDPVSNEGYFIGTDTVTYGTLILRRVSNPGGSPTLSSNLVLTVPATNYPATVTQPNTTSTLATLDDRLFLAKICEGPGGVRTLWTAHNVGTNTSGVATANGNPGSRWYQVSGYATGSTPTLVQAGTVFDTAATNPVAYWIPSIVQTPQGNSVLGGSFGGKALYAGAFYSYRRSGDALGTLTAPGQIVPGGGYYTGTRWGDYSMATVDPTDGQSVWLFQEYVAASPAGGNLGTYAVYTQKVMSDAPVATGQSANTARRGAGTTMTVTGTNFFNGPARYTNHLAATVSGTGVTVTGVTYVSPTQVQLNLAVAANATLGARTVTITNPDGQSTTSSFTVQPILVSGTITYGDYLASAPRPATTVELLDASNNVVDTRSVTPAADGTFSFEPTVNAQAYSVRVKASHWLRRRVTNVDASGGTASFSATLINGDADGDNQILGSDYAVIRSNYGTTNPAGDMDGDGQVLGSDYAIVRAHYGQIGDN